MPALEHVLRAAILNDEDSGMQRTDTASQLNKYGSLSETIKEAENTHLMDGCDKDWWDAVSRVIRNRVYICFASFVEKMRKRRKTS